MTTSPPTGTAAIERPGFREFVALMAAVMAMVALGIDSMLPALPAIGNSLGVNAANDRQYVIAAFMIGFGVAQLFVGTLTDRYGRRPVLLGALTLYVIFAIVAAAAPSFELLIAARAAQGAAAAGGRVTVVSVVRDRFAGRQMARVMSLAFIVLLAAPILAPGVGQLILLAAPWRWIFAVLAIIGALVATWAAIRLPETLPVERRVPITPGRIRASWARVVADRMSSGYTFAGAFMFGAMMAYLNSVQQIFADVFHQPDMLAPLFAAMAATMAVGSFMNSRLVVRLGMRFMSHWAVFAFITFAGLHLAISVSGQETLIAFAILQSLMMSSMAIANANFSALAMERLGDVAGTASSLQGAFSTTAGAVIGTEISQHFDGTTVPLYTGFLLCGVGSLAAILVTERGRLFRRTPQDALA